MTFNPESQPHRRFNPLNGQWVMVSPHRANRPWQGQTERAPEQRSLPHDPGCYLCPGNRRASGDVNPRYAGTYVFDNDFPALLPQVMPGGAPPVTDPLLRAEPARGVCRVICFSPRHDLTLAELAPSDLVGVVDTWASETAALGKRHRWVQLFENKGAVMGCSNPHPHGQVWALDALPSEPAAEDRHQRSYLDAHGSALLADYANRERALGERVVYQNDSFLAVVPFWAAWPFETLLLPRRRVARLTDLALEERRGLADLLSTLLTAYDRLFDVSFPYSLGWHGAPFGDEPVDHWQLHAHIYPPLLRSATVRKFMVGYEMMAEPQRDLTQERAATMLRDVIQNRPPATEVRNRHKT